MTLQRMKLQTDEFRKARILSRVVYDTQRDNEIDPLRTCFPTSIAMVLRSLEDKKNGGRGRRRFTQGTLETNITKELQDNRKAYTKITISLVGQIVAKLFPRYVFGFWVWYINGLPGFKAEFKRMTPGQIRVHLGQNETPVIVGTKLTGGGHIIVVKGFRKELQLICNDPYGDANSNYKNHDGESVAYYDYQLPKTMNALIIERTI